MHVDADLGLRGHSQSPQHDAQRERTGRGGGLVLTVRRSQEPDYAWMRA